MSTAGTSLFRRIGAVGQDRRGTLQSQVLQTYSELPHKNLQDTCTRQGVLFATLFMLCMRVCAELESSAYATVQVWVVSRSASWENVSCI